MSSYAFPVYSSAANSWPVVVKKTVHERNWSTKAREPALHTRARQEAYKDEVGTCEDRGGWIW